MATQQQLEQALAKKPSVEFVTKTVQNATSVITGVVQIKQADGAVLNIDANGMAFVTDEEQTGQISTETIRTGSIQALQMDADKIKTTNMQAQQVISDVVKTKNIQALQMDADRIETTNMQAQEVISDVVKTEDVQTQQITANNAIFDQWKGLPLVKKNIKDADGEIYQVLCIE